MHSKGFDLASWPVQAVAAQVAICSTIDCRVLPGLSDRFKHHGSFHCHRWFSRCSGSAVQVFYVLNWVLCGYGVVGRLRARVGPAFAFSDPCCAQSLFFGVY